MEKQYVISLVQVNTLLAYLQNRPFKEVVSLIGILNDVSKTSHEEPQSKVNGDKNKK